MCLQRTYIRSLHDMLFSEPEGQPRPDLEAVATRLWSAIEHWPHEKVCAGTACTISSLRMPPFASALMCTLAAIVALLGLRLASTAGFTRFVCQCAEEQ